MWRNFPGHIACSSLSRSEIVVPVFDGGEVVGVLDVDSTALNTFDEEDQRWLEELVRTGKWGKNGVDVGRQRQ